MEVSEIKAEDLCPNYVRAFVHQEIKSIDTTKREIRHSITSAVVDRGGDVVEPGGAQIDNFKRNPVVIADHTYSISTVIGWGLDIVVTPKTIDATTKYRDTMLADEAFRLAQDRLGGWSIGFQPMESHSVQDGSKQDCKSCKKRFAAMSEGKAPGDYVPAAMWSRHYTKWDLLEYSAVAIPMNQDIVNNAIARGLVSRENAPIFFRSITPEPSVTTEAAPGPTVEAVEMHPVLASALRAANIRIDKRFALAAVERGVRDALEKIHGNR